MKPEIFYTKDGSASLQFPATGVCYHSRNGALQESRHVYIQAGLHELLKKNPAPVIRLLEMGLGTGLNVLLTLTALEQTSVHVTYTALENFPLPSELFTSLGYCEMIGRKDLQEVFERIHTAAWEHPLQLSTQLNLIKRNCDPATLEAVNKFHLIYYDAFAPSAQPQMWTSRVFSNLFELSEPGALLVTYCSKGEVKRNLKQGGWMVEKIPGPAGKREMLRARKPG